MAAIGKRVQCKTDIGSKAKRLAEEEEETNKTTRRANDRTSGTRRNGAIERAVVAHDATMGMLPQPLVLPQTRAENKRQRNAYHASTTNKAGQARRSRRVDEAMAMAMAMVVLVLVVLGASARNK
jgi:hypothetical protein